MKIGAALRRGPLLAARREHFREEIAEGRRVIAAAAREVEPLEAGCPAIVAGYRRTGVIAGAPLRIDQRFVGLENLPETCFGRPVTRIDVRVEPPREAPVGALDFRLRRAVLETEDDVKVHLLLLFVDDLCVDDIALSTF